jgi:hypothetical protein
LKTKDLSASIGVYLWPICLFQQPARPRTDRIEYAGGPMKLFSPSQRTVIRAM